MTKEAKKTSSNKKDIKNKKTKAKSKFDLKKYLTKENIIYSVVAIIDIALIIYMARKNTINYVSIEDNDPIYLGAKHNLFLGRNYITLVITGITYIYFLILNKFYFQKKIQKKYLIISLIVLLLTNCILFYLFTNKVY